jgi:hypothetical protein
MQLHRSAGRGARQAWPSSGVFECREAAESSGERVMCPQCTSDSAKAASGGHVEAVEEANFLGAARARENASAGWSLAGSALAAEK